MGIRIRVSEQDLHCLFRPTGVSRALNDRLEENALSISLFPKPLGAWWVNIRLDGDTCDDAIYLMPFLRCSIFSLSRFALGQQTEDASSPCFW
jgi:hypothetical protein